MIEKIFEIKVEVKLEDHPGLDQYIIGHRNYKFHVLADTLPQAINKLYESVAEKESLLYTDQITKYETNLVDGKNIKFNYNPGPKRGIVIVKLEVQELEGFKIL